jgi:hypothetical protein
LLSGKDVDLLAGTLTVARSRDADTTKGGREVTLPVPEPLSPYLERALRGSRSQWLFPKPDGEQRSLDLDVTAVLRRALGRAGIVEGYEHRSRKPGCGHVERAQDDAQRRCPKDGRALWLRPLPRRLSFAANLLPTGSVPEVEAPDRSRVTEEDRGLQMVGATGFEPATTCTPRAVTRRAGRITEHHQVASS